MRRQVIALGWLAAGVSIFGGAATAHAVEPLASGGVGDCASVTASARLRGYGYSHIVTLANHCDRAVSCEVWTNVDPTPHLMLSAKPGESVETVARYGSPSREVQAGKSCRFVGG